MAVPTVIATANGKGGVGKTSVTANLSALLAAAGYKVLVIDWDKQGNLGEEFGYTDRSDEGRALVSAVIAGGPLLPMIDIRPGLDVCASGDRLPEVAAAITTRERREGPEAWLALRDSLEQVWDRYDVVLIDCPPSDEVLQKMALVAARWLLIPTQVDASSRKAIRAIGKEFVKARELNPELGLLGVVLFGVNSTATRVREDARRWIEEDLQGSAPVLSSVIRFAQKAAVDARRRGELAHELERAAAEAPTYWEVRAGAEPGPSIAASASSLAGDYQRLAEEVVGLLRAADATVDESAEA